MKRVLRNKKTRAYLKTKGNWVSDYRLAKDFKDIHSAITAAKQHQLKGVEVVLQFGSEPSEKYDITLPLLD